MTYGCKIMVSLTLCRFFGPPCIIGRFYARKQLDCFSAS